MEYEVLCCGDRVHHAGFGYGTVDSLSGDDIYSVIWDNGQDRLSMIAREDLMMLPVVEASGGSPDDCWNEMVTQWRLTRQVIEHTLEGRPNGFDPHHLAELRSQELLEWQALENLASMAVTLAEAP